MSIGDISLSGPPMESNVNVGASTTAASSSGFQMPQAQIFQSPIMSSPSLNARFGTFDEVASSLQPLGVSTNDNVGADSGYFDEFGNEIP